MNKKQSYYFLNAHFEDSGTGVFLNAEVGDGGVAEHLIGLERIANFTGFEVNHIHLTCKQTNFK